ncbi:hypothetical protein [Pseudodesulfovibrio senegalensis]|uniref:hypothetical protein n=1 Tax=Pseudodesulfovibrio senegalensis TaxID=1721087 RepID=UPI0014789879|nr:hypothetical protein [Pseudodesulfovibrio senegalensis]
MELSFMVVCPGILSLGHLFPFVFKRISLSNVSTVCSANRAHRQKVLEIPKNLFPKRFFGRRRQKKRPAPVQKTVRLPSENAKKQDRHDAKNGNYRLAFGSYNESDAAQFPV